MAEQTVVLKVAPGEVFDRRWRIETRIGQGAMGSVFRGTDLQSGRIVAVKILSPDHCRKPKVLARFEREADLMMTIQHPNIVRMYGHGRRGAVPYLVMEHLEGFTLAELQQRSGGKMAIEDVVALLRQVAAGLTFLHHHELVHRDIKPQNVFLAGDGRTRILDLGVVRDQANPGLTRPGAMVGTPYYMSPEQILGLEDVDKRTDVYALAATAFELLTGRPPYLGANNFEVLYGHKNAPVPDASTLVKGLSKGVSKVLGRGLAKRREERYETANEFALDLEGAVGEVKVDLLALYRRFASARDTNPKENGQDDSISETRPPTAARPAGDAAAPMPVRRHTRELPVQQGLRRASAELPAGAAGRRPTRELALVAPEPESAPPGEATAPRIPASQRAAAAAAAAAAAGPKAPRPSSAQAPRAAPPAPEGAPDSQPADSNDATGERTSPRAPAPSDSALEAGEPTSSASETLGDASEERTFVGTAPFREDDARPERRKDATSRGGGEI